jgi:hypothetical protein
VLRWLLTAKDFSLLKDFYARRVEGVVLERRYRDELFIRVSMKPATDPWDCPWLVRLETRRGSIYTSQYFDGVEEMIERGL